VCPTKYLQSLVCLAPVAMFTAHLHLLCQGCSCLLCYIRVCVVEVVFQNLAPHGLVTRGLEVTTTAQVKAGSCFKQCRSHMQREMWNCKSAYSVPKR
jgi:hypothetical protein